MVLPFYKGELEGIAFTDRQAWLNSYKSLG